MLSGPVEGHFIDPQPEHIPVTSQVSQPAKFVFAVHCVQSALIVAVEVANFWGQVSGSGL